MSKKSSKSVAKKQTPKRKRSSRPRSHPRAKTYCKYCSQVTAGDKDFCIDHIDQSPYAKQLLATMAKIEKEVASVKSRGSRAIKPNSQVVIAILEELKVKKKMTYKKLAQTLDISVDTLTKYLNYLQKKKKVVLGLSTRKETRTVEIA